MIEVFMPTHLVFFQLMIYAGVKIFIDAIYIITVEMVYKRGVAIS
jgi:hypothetical protein